MQKTLSLLAAHRSVCIAEDKADGGKEITLSGAITTDNDVGLGGEGLDDSLVLVADDENMLASSMRQEEEKRQYEKGGVRAF